MGTALGSKCLIHSFRRYRELYKETANLKALLLDIRNTFNTVDRAIFIPPILDEFPELAFYVVAVYRGSSQMITPSWALFFSTEVQRGDPLGPFLFSVGLNVILKRTTQ